MVRVSYAVKIAHKWLVLPLALTWSTVKRYFMIHLEKTDKFQRVQNRAAQIVCVVTQ